MKKTALIATPILVLSVSLFYGLSFHSVEATGNSWAIKESIPVAGAHFKAGVVNDKIYIVDKNFTYEYNLYSWSPKKPMLTYRGDFSLATYQNKIYCIGGRTNFGPSGTNEVYDPASDSWESKAAMPTPRHGLEANVVNGKIYLISGLVPHRRFPPNGLYNTFELTNVNEVYDPATDTWTTKSPIPNAASYYASAVINNKIYITSENVTQQGVDREALTQIYDPEADTWSYGAAPPYNVDMAGGATVVGVLPQRFYVIGGRQEGLEVDYNQAYDPENNLWSLGAPLITARYGLAVAVAKGKIYAIGGLSGFLYNAVWTNKNEMYDPLKDQALPTTLSPTPEPEPFPTSFVIASVITLAVVSVALLLYFKKRKHGSGDKT